MVEARAPHRAQEALADRILLSRMVHIVMRLSAEAQIQVQVAEERHFDEDHRGDARLAGMAVEPRRHPPAEEKSTTAATWRSR